MFLGNYFANLEAFDTQSNGFCYVLTSDVQLVETFGSSFDIFVTFNVPTEERPKTLNGILSLKNDYNLLHYKSWPGTKPYTFNVNVGEMVTLQITKQIWNFYPHSKNRKCKKYEEPNQGFVQCWIKKFTRNLQKHKVCQKI